MKGRMIVLAVAVIAIVAAALMAFSGSDSDSSKSGNAPEQTKETVRLTFVYSPEKEQLLRQLIERFNADGQVSDGKRVIVSGQVLASGDAETKIAAGRLKPVLWSPASSFWGRLLNFEADQALVPDESPSIVRTPLVIGMWEQLADAYGYPKRPMGYRELGDLARGGWASAGKPAFGSFKFVHTNPDFSTAGLSEVAAQYYAAAGKKEGLTERDVSNPKVRRQVRDLEEAIVHYGDTTLFIADEMRRNGMGYASAAAMEETTLIDFNRRAQDGQRLVAVYPTEGTFFSDNPLITLQGSWVSAEQKAAAKVFERFLAAEITPDTAGRYGFRPADESKAPAGLVSADNGVDPRQPARRLSLPEPKVLAKIKAAWREDRKPANVMVVFDNSGSMGEEGKLEQAKAGLRAFFEEAAPQDRMGLMKFSNQVTPLVDIAPMKTNRSKLIAAVDSIFPEDDTRVRDATVEGVKAVEAKLDRDAINAVVVLTDGEDTASARTAEQVVRELEPQGEKESGQIRVFTIAYGADPNETELASYAEATGGKSFRADTSDIERVYRSISSFF